MENAHFEDESNLREAIFNLFCIYYVINMRYNKHVSHLLLVIQCMFLKIHTEDISKPKAAVAKFVKLVDFLKQ